MDKAIKHLERVIAEMAEMRVSVEESIDRADRNAAQERRA